jgi:Lrp/AsnC family leucine-responsive transcriptional regulator
MTDSTKIGPTDLRILEVLQRDGRRPYADLGSEVGISGPSAHERVKKLEARRIITGYTATVDPVAAGFPILAFCWLTQAPGTNATDITADFATVTEVEECHHIAGEADYLLKLRARSTTDLERVLRRIQAIRHVFTTETDVVLSTAFERRPLGRADETGGATGA